MGSLYKRADCGGKKSVYHAAFIDHTGKRVRRSTGVTDKQAAREIMQKWITDERRRANGVIDHAAERIAGERARSVEDLLAEWKNSKLTGGKTSGHIEDTIRLVRDVAEFGKWQTISDMVDTDLEAYAAKLKQEFNRSARTIQKLVTALKQFGKWCEKNNRLAKNPFSEVDKPDPETDRRLERRMIQQAEWPWLLKALAEAPHRNGLAGSERAILYRLGIETGLRVQELIGLHRGKLHLDSKPPFVLCKGAGTKNRKDAQQFVSSRLARDLKKLIKDRSAGESIFPFERTHASEVLRDDMALARTLWLDSAKDAKERSKREATLFLAATNEAGEKLTFHSLRHTCGAWAALANAPVKSIQTLMRHSTVQLTIDTYGHLMPQAQSGLAELIGSMLT